MVFVVVAAWLVALGVKASRSLGRWHPATLFVWGWVATLLMVWLNPLGAEPVSPVVLLIIFASISVFVTAAIIVGQRRTELVAPEPGRPPGPVGIRFTAVAAVVLLLVFVGYSRYKAYVASALGVNSLASVGRATIRQATTLGAAQHGGLGVLLLSLCPLLGCIGIEGYVRTRRAAWLLLVPLGIGLISVDPGRAGVLGTITASIAYFAYRLRATSDGRRPRRTPRRRAAVLAVVGVAFGLFFFIQHSSSSSLDPALNGAKVSGYVPRPLIEPLLYWTGGVNAFSGAFQEGVNPFEHPGRPVSIVFRAAQIIDPSVEQPSSDASYAYVPFATNVYTAFGDAWFAYGLGGVVLLMGTLGAMASALHRRALSGGPEWAWLASLLATALANTLLSFSVFVVAVLFPAAVGWVLLRGTKTRSGTRRPQRLVGSTSQAI